MKYVVDWPLLVSIVSALFAGMAWLHALLAFRGPRLTLENSTANQKEAQHAVVLPFGKHPAATRDLFPEYSVDLKYALARVVWLNLGDRAGAVHVKKISATAPNHDVKCSWYSYVSVPPDAAHAEPILLRGLPDDVESDVTVTIAYEWLRIRWWSRGKRKAVPGEAQIAVRATPPPLPLQTQ